MHTNITKFMFIILSIYSKNSNSLTNFLRFFYKLKTNKTLKIKFFSVQSPKNTKFSFFSVLQSPHVNKKSQEQFEYHMYCKQLKVHVSQLEKFLFIWKIVKTRLFFDIKIETHFLSNNKLYNYSLLTKTDYDKFIYKFFKKKSCYLPKACKWNFLNYQQKNQLSLTNLTGQTFLKLLDIHGEILLKNRFKFKTDSGYFNTVSDSRMFGNI